MLNSTEHGNSTAHKTNTLTKKTFFLSASWKERKVFLLQHLRVGKKEKIVFVSIFHANTCQNAIIVGILTSMSMINDMFS